MRNILPSPRWRWAAWYIVLVTVGGTVSTAIGPFEVLPGVPGSMSILAVPGLSTETLDAVGGFVSSAVVGYLAIRFFLRFVVHHSLRAFSYYRFGLAAVVAVLLLLGVGGEF